MTQKDSISSLAVGSIFDGKYEIVSVIGAGGMGEVYKARHTHLGALRCIKVIKKSFSSDEGFRARFLREARLATKVHHPNVAIVHDFATAPDGSYYLVSEFIDGITLREWSTHNGRFPVGLAADIAVQALAGLHEIHRAGLVHRDISADNIMIKYDGERWRAKIIDLGIAKAIEAPAAEKTQVGLFVGNPRYASPEQLGDLAEGEEIDARADIYCFGVVFYEMIIGRPPFTSNSPQGYIAKHLKQPPPRLTEALPGSTWPSGLEPVLMKALQKHREDRYPSAKDFARSLQPFLSATSHTAQMDLRELLRDKTPTPPPPARITPAAGEEKSPEKKLPETKKPHSPVPADAKTTPAAPAASAAKPKTRQDEKTVALPRATHEPPIAETVRLDKLPTLSEIAKMEDAGSTGDLERLAVAFHDTTSIGKAAREALGRIRSRLAAREDAAWEDAVAAGTSAHWKTYVEQFFDSSRVAEARERLAEATAYEVAIKRDDVAGWDAYLEAHPSSYRFEDATARRIAAWRREVESALQAAHKSGKAEGYRAFLAKFPGTEQTREVERRIEELDAYERANAAADIDALSAFLDRWPSSDRAAAARARRDELQRIKAEKEAFERAAAVNTPAEWQRFLAEHPGGAHASQAGAELKRLEDAAFQSFVEAKNPDDADGFLSIFPTGARVQQVKRLAAEWREESAIAAEWSHAQELNTIDGYRAFVHARPMSRFAGEAQRRVDEFEALRAIEQAEASSDVKQIRQIAKKNASNATVATVANDAIKRVTERQTAREEEQQWESARRASTTKAVRKFIAQYPASRFLEEAEQLLTQAEEYEFAVAEKSVEGLAAFAARWPNTRLADEAQKKLAVLRERQAGRSVGGSSVFTSFDDVGVELDDRQRLVAIGGVAAAVIVVLVIGWLVISKKPDVADAARPSPAVTATNAGATSTASTPPVVQPGFGLLAIDSLPWANVTSVRDDAGKEWITGANLTPLALAVPPGRYTVSFARPDGRTTVATADVAAMQTANCVGEFSPIDPIDYFEDAGWR